MKTCITALFILFIGRAYCQISDLDLQKGIVANINYKKLESLPCGTSTLGLHMVSFRLDNNGNPVLNGDSLHPSVVDSILINAIFSSVQQLNKQQKSKLKNNLIIQFVFLNINDDCTTFDDAEAISKEKGDHRILNSILLRETRRVNENMLASLYTLRQNSMAAQNCILLPLCIVEEQAYYLHKAKID